MERDVVIVSACRTAVGAFGGTLKDMNAATIARVTMRAAIERAGIERDEPHINLLLFVQRGAQVATR